MINIIFQENPFSDDAMDSILEMRDIAASAPDVEPLIEMVYVGGGTALMYDFASTMSIDFERIIALAIILIYIVLMFVLGSVLNPLRSILTILLSIFWTLAITSLVFQWTMDMYLNFQVPLILIVVCLGLGMDYDILLSTRIREEVHKGMSTNEAIKHSLLETGGIITACGVHHGLRLRFDGAHGQPHAHAVRPGIDVGDPARRHCGEDVPGAGHHVPARQVELVGAQVDPEEERGGRGRKSGGEKG